MRLDKPAEADLVFRALGDPTRRRLLELVASEEKSVKELTAQFKMSQSAISQHLRLLREAGLARERRVGRNHYYRMEEAPLQRVEEWLHEHTNFWSAKLEGLGSYLRGRHGQEDQI